MKISLMPQASRKLAEAKLTIDQLGFSVERVIYYVSVPTVNSRLLALDSKDITTRLTKDGYGWVEPHSWEIYADLQEEQLLLAELPFGLFEVPALDTLRGHGQLTAGEHSYLYILKFLDKSTPKAVAHEVYHKLTDD